jgi:hypothetical protein
LRGVPDPYDGAGGDPYHHWTRRLNDRARAGATRLGSQNAGIYRVVYRGLDGPQVTVP